MLFFHFIFYKLHQLTKNQVRQFSPWLFWSKKKSYIVQKQGILHLRGWPASCPTGLFQLHCSLSLTMPKGWQLNITHQIYHRVLTEAEARWSNIANIVLRNGCWNHTDHKAATLPLFVERLPFPALNNHHICWNHSLVQSREYWILSSAQNCRSILYCLN